MANNLPDRYGIEYRQFQGRPEKAIYRRDLAEKGNRLLMVRGLSVPKTDLESPDHPPAHVYLDGAARGPFYDSKRGIFSLDHHDGCVRSITDATCVQGINLARTRVISALGHTIIGNEPDGDTVLGGWALLNADLVGHDERVFRRTLPLYLVEGNIDTHGFGYEELTGLPQEVIMDSRQRLLWLLQEERDLKQRGKWGTADFVDFTEHALRKVDRFALFRDNLDTPVCLDIHEAIPLRNEKTLHFAQTPESGIYEVEYTILNHFNDKECVCIIFHDGKTKWTIKLTGFVNDLGLEKVSDLLNKEELLVKQQQGMTDERLLSARWGGGNSIIGAPRYYNGSSPFLSKQQIVAIVTSALNEQIG